MDHTQLTWYAPKYIHTHKSQDWYWVVCIVAGAIAIIAFIVNNVLFGILVIVGTFSLVLRAKTVPEMHAVKIDSRGVMIDKVIYPYENIRSVWVETEQLVPRLMITSNKKWSPLIVVLLGNSDPDEVREFLSKKVPIVHASEPFLEKMLIFLGF